MSSDDDPFEEVLNLEEKYYKEGYDEGYKDGAEAGRIEGRSVGMKQGFEKFVEAGRLQARATIWANRIPNLRRQSTLYGDSQNTQKDSQNTQQDLQKQASPQEPSSNSQGEKKPEPESEADAESELPKTLPLLNSNTRLEKNVLMLYGLMEPGTLSTTNDDESVNDFDSRMKAAQGRAKMIERAIGEGTKKGSAERFRPSQPIQKNENIEDIGQISRRTEGEGKG
ncbi:DUF1715-domain-containing protein [Annulohypoxylon maeteangense]|uniref:DUF1715-domain-containing protein n=1 Tax=Annulohypoxylon maeteangense TaxID=1927788 RepID=UPI002007E0FA|nr:DUF1715-domain-containing protein [Annulohypoxylon maeteangense]KAI0885566.1 DUF1715-domain-containing protein [Annulohypoxylon maeteangense]